METNSIQSMLKDDFEYLIETSGEPVTVSEYEGLPESMEGKVSELYAELLKRYGRCNLAGGRIQLIAPPDLQPIVDMVLAGDRDLGKEGDAFAFAYSPFGNIHFWHSKYGLGEIDLVQGRVKCLDLTDPPPADEPPPYPLRAMNAPFFASIENMDFYDAKDAPMFGRAHKELGEIGFLECYGFVPALALGGENTLENLKKMQALAHFAILAQATDFTLMRFDMETFSIKEVRAIDRDQTS